ncbi:MAG: ABC transporter substrate-binding protein [Thermomicrobiales bacterium]
MNRRITRRRLLQVAGGSSFTVLMLANGNKIVAQTPVGGMDFKEAPALADLVAAGTLPPVGERLPSEPLVVEPTEMVGKYGGTWRTAVLGGADQHVFQRYIGYDHLVRFSEEWDEVIPSLASAYEISADNRTYTFTLRPGHKWSDGEPFGVDDILFYVNDVTLNAELGVGQPDNNPFTVEKIDDVTFAVTFERANGLFMQQRLCGLDSGWTQNPKHYLGQFHPTYNTTNLDQLVSEAGAADWVELFKTKGGVIPGSPVNALWTNPELPRLHAWTMVEPYGVGTRVTFQRNPYYYKVDTEGNQLPYIDGINYDVVEDIQVLLLKALNGELDMHMRHFCTLRNKPVLADGLEAAQLEFFDANPSIMNTDIYMLNQTHKNPALREIFQNKDFRIGLSYAINRQEVIDVVYVSQGEPWQAAPRVETPYYNETLAKQYTEYDVALANEHLDKVLPNKDGDGWRLRPDGEKLTFVVEVPVAGEFPEMVDTSSLIIPYWREVGIDVQAMTEDRSLFQARCDANDHDAAVWPGGSGLQDALLNPYNYMAFAGMRFGVPWVYWWTKPAEPLAEPEQGPEAIVAQQTLFDQIRATADTEEQTQLLNEILTIAQENFWVIGVALPGMEYGIKKTNFRNVPMTGMPQASVYPNPGPSNPAQFFFDQ